MPASVFRQRFRLSDPDGSGAPFGEIALHLFNGGRLVVGDAEFELEARDLFKNAVALVSGRETVAVARRPSLLSRRTEVSIWAATLGLDMGTLLELVPEGWTGRRWAILADGLDAGTARWDGAIRPVLRVDASEALSLPVQAFIAAVLVIQRRRESNGG